MNLRHATQAVRILDPRIMLAMRFANFTFRQQRTQMSRDLYLAGMRTGSVNSFIERGWCSLQCFQRHGAGKICQSSNAFCPQQGQASYSRHRLRAIQQREALLGRKP